MNGAELIAIERKRQIEAEGWSEQHDDAHAGGQLAIAARCYIQYAGRQCGLPHYWPWEERWWKPSGDAIRDLTKAGALIAAEIDRLQRSKRTG